MLEQQNTPVALEETAIQELVSRMRGELLRPSDAGYEQAIRVYNGMIEKRPALIAHCVDVADVIAAVNFAREHELTLAVRGGGHSGPGLGTCDDGLVIDLSGMKGIRVDPSARTARIEGDFCRRADQFFDLVELSLKNLGDKGNQPARRGIRLQGGCFSCSQEMGFLESLIKALAKLHARVREKAGRDLFAAEFYEQRQCSRHRVSRFGHHQTLRTSRESKRERRKNSLRL